MRSTLLASVILIVLFAQNCKKDTELTELPINLGHFELGDFIGMIPIDTAKAYNYAIYTNEQGDEKYLLMEWFELERNQEMGIRNYSYDEVQIQYHDEDPSYVLSIAALGGLNRRDNTFVRTLFVDILAFAMSSASITIDEVGDEVNEQFRSFHTSLQLGEQTFTNVYASEIYAPISNTSFQELYYNTRLGIVAFEGWNDTLWVLDRFEH